LVSGLRDDRAVTRAGVRLGEIGEELAVQALERQGYAILARRYRRRGGEIDIVAVDGATVVFVEVKARDGSAFGGGSEAVTALKRHRLTATARDFLARHRLEARPCRFDVVAIDVSSGAPRLEVIRNAFDATE
jgi:putative endonuclease